MTELKITDELLDELESYAKLSHYSCSNIPNKDVLALIAEVRRLHADNTKLIHRLHEGRMLITSEHLEQFRKGYNAGLRFAVTGEI